MLSLQLRGHWTIRRTLFPWKKDLSSAISHNLCASGIIQTLALTMPFRKLFKLLLILLPIFPNALASNPPGLANCTHPTAFFPQQVDHASGQNETFLQQYQILDEFYKPGGPILFYQGAESSTMGCLVGFSSDSWGRPFVFTSMRRKIPSLRPGPKRLER